MQFIFFNWQISKATNHANPGSLEKPTFRIFLQNYIIWFLHISRHLQSQMPSERCYKRVQFYSKQINVNYATFYFVGCCTYHGSSEIKCPAIGSERLKAKILTAKFIFVYSSFSFAAICFIYIYIYIEHPHTTQDEYINLCCVLSSQ